MSLGRQPREPRIPGIRRLFRLPMRGASIARDVDDEIRFHIDSRAGDLERGGLSPDEARATAEREFGDVRAARRELADVDRRRVRRDHRADLLAALAQDLRFAARSLRKQPGLAAAVVLTLALGIGANATMFGVVDRLMLRPPAYLTAPQQTGRVYLVQHRADGTERIDRNINYLRYTELRDSTATLETVAAFFDQEKAVGEGEDVRQRRVSAVSGNFWRLFDARPALGRFFGPDEDRLPAGSPVAVLGHEFWKSRFGGRSDAIGEKLRIGGTVYTVVGVAPPGFAGMSMAPVTAFYPITSEGFELSGGSDRFGRGYGMSWLEIVARRKSDAGTDRTNADLSRAFTASLTRQLVEAQPARLVEQLRPRAILGSIHVARGPIENPAVRVSAWLLGVAVIVLLVACANVTNLLLARALGRRREIAVRIALGVGRGRLVSQLLVESLLLAALAGGAGLVLAHWGGALARSVLLPDAAWSGTLTDWRLLGFGLGVALLAGLLVGIVPALQASRPDVADALKAGGREGSHHRSRVRAALLVAQASLSVVLLVGAGLFVRSLRQVRALDMGLDLGRLLVVRVETRGTPLPPAERRALQDRMEARSRELPAVENVAVTVTVPFWRTINEDLYTPGVDSLGRLGDFYQNAVSPSYFATTGTRILSGRGIEATDRDSAAKVVVVSRSMARTIWKTEDVLGRCLRVGADTMPCSTVVGVAQDLRWGTFDETGRNQYYLSSAQSRPVGWLYVRTRGDARRAMEPIRRELQRLVPGAAYVEAKPMQDVIDPSLRSWQLGATMFTVFGLLALAVAAVGLYSVIAYGVARRGHELGVRMALGARAADVVRLVLGEGVRVAVVGVALGTALALALAKRVAPLLFETKERDPLIYAAVGLTLIVVAALASLLPAWRASRVSPARALRGD